MKSLLLIQSLFLGGFIAIVSLGITSCKPTETKSNVYVQDSLLTSISRRPCFGKCPVFVFTVYKSGYATYLGEQNVTNKGFFETRLSTEIIKVITQEIRNAKIESLDTFYNNKYLADYPNWTVSVCDKQPKKVINVNHENPPVELVNYAKLLDKISNEALWKSPNGTNE
jgi:Domain of unknown function (DUF6438)